MAVTIRAVVVADLDLEDGESIPARASCSPIQAELVSTICPSSSSVPMARTSQRIGCPVRLAGGAAQRRERPGRPVPAGCRAGTGPR